MESPLCPPTAPGFRLIETFRWEPGGGILRRDRNLARLARSAFRLGIEPQGVEAVLGALSGGCPLRVRLSVDRNGMPEITTARFHALPEGQVWRVAIASQRLSANDPWLGVKTSQRQLYDTARANLPDGIDEWIFRNENDVFCEGTITNLFADLGEGLLTPPLQSGLLPGVLREEMIATGAARETPLALNHLLNASALFVGNSLRGLIPARLVAL